MADNREIQQARRRLQERFKREQQQTSLVNEFLHAQGHDSEELVRERMRTRGFAPEDIEQAVRAARSYRNSEEVEGIT